MYRILYIFVIWLALSEVALGKSVHRNSAEYEQNSDHVRKSKEIRKYMNTSADPCEDYYEFVCGNWRVHNPATGAVTHTSGFTNSNKNFIIAAKELLNSNYVSNSTSEEKVLQFYESCQTASKITPSEYRNQIKELITEFGEMPALKLGEPWQDTDFKWLKTVGKIANKYDINILYQFTIENDKDPKSNSLIIEPPMFALKIGTPLRGIRKYQSKVENDLQQYLGLKRPYVSYIAEDIVNFELALVRAVAGERKVMNIKNLPMNILNVLNLTFGYVPKGQIIMRKPRYFPQMTQIIQKTHKSIVANYIFYQLLKEFTKNFEQDLNNRNCVQQVIRNFPDVISKMVYRAYNLEPVALKFQHLWQEMVISLKNIFENNQISWYDDEIRDFSTEKLHLMRMIVVTFEDTDLDREYEHLYINPNDFVANIKSLKIFKADKYHSSLNERPNYVMRALNFQSPVYQSRVNAVIMSVATLVGDFFTTETGPKALTYARLLRTFGHEITHAFGGRNRYMDGLGRDFGPVGNSENDFRKRVNCLYNQYEYFEHFTTMRPQDENQTENISDVAGIVLAYGAYMRWLSSNERTEEELRRETLPNLNFTGQQLFFIYGSQTWCSDYTEEYEKQTAENTHSLFPYRAVLPLLNFKEFANVFNCPVGSVMNPRKRCSLA